jgi:hypothetical protein
MKQIISDILDRIDKKTVQRAGGYPLGDSILEHDIENLVAELKKEESRYGILRYGICHPII